MFVSALFGLLGAFLWALLKTPEDALSTSMKNDDQFKDQVLDYHNFFREQHGAEDLSWNASIAGMAEEWASNCNFKHSVISSRTALEAGNLLIIARTASRAEPRRRIPRRCALY